jgi:hypothetical protein
VRPEPVEVGVGQGVRLVGDLPAVVDAAAAETPRRAWQPACTTTGAIRPRIAGASRTAARGHADLVGAAVRIVVPRGFAFDGKLNTR